MNFQPRKLMKKLKKHVPDTSITLFGVVLAALLTGLISWWTDQLHQNNILRRLNEDLVITIGFATKDLLAYKIKLETMSHVRHLDNMNGYSSYDENLCDAIDLSHSNVWQPKTVGVLAEIRSTGSLSLIDSAAVRGAMAEFIATQEFNHAEMNAIRNHTVVLREEFPELIAAKLAPPSPERDGKYDLFDINVDCNWEGMKNDQMFMNAFIGNIHMKNQAVTAIRREKFALECLRESVEADQNNFNVCLESKLDAK